MSASAFGGRDQYDFSGAHPEWIEALDGYIDSIIPTTYREAPTVVTHRVQVARRLVDWVAKTCPGLAPRDFTDEHADEHRAYVYSVVPEGSSLRSWTGAREMFDQMQRSELRAADQTNPFASRKSVRLEPPAGLPTEVTRWRDQLVAWGKERAATRISTNGEDGLDEDYVRQLIRTLDQFLYYVINHNAALLEAKAVRNKGASHAMADDEPWPLDLNFLFSRTEPAAEFLKDAPKFGRTIDDGLKERSRQKRKGSLLRVYRELRRLSKGTIGASDFRQRLAEEVLGGRRKAHLGGGDSDPVEALTLKEVRAVEALLEKRIAAARIKQDQARTQKESRTAWRAMYYALRARAIWEVGLWSGLRIQALASIDLSKFEQLPNGSWVCHDVRMKAYDGSLWKTQWIAPRAIRALEEFLTFSGRTLR